jgi:protein-disulfide isomerase-like protein with CxxC motif
MNKTILPALVLFIIGAANAQQVTNFSLNNVLNGKPVTLDTYPSCAGLVIIFTSNVCAYDEYYRDRIARISSAHQDVPVLFVNAGLEPQESIENMKRKAKELAPDVPYLADKEQKLMRQLGATKTPQAFLLKNNNGKFSVVFRGAIDDNPQVAADVRHAYLEDAIDIMLTNQKIETPEVRPVGCTIRKL